MTERTWFNVGAVKLPSGERDVAASVFTAHPERFADVIGADTADDDDQYPVGSHTAYSAHLTDREAEQFSRASNCRYVEPDQVHHNVTQADPNIPRPLSLRYVQADPAWYPTLTGTNIRIADIDTGTAAAMRTAKNLTLVNKATFTGSDPPNGDSWPAQPHGSYTGSIAVPFGGLLVDAIGIDGNNSTTDSAIANAITWVMGQNAQLVNMSLTLGAYSSVVNDALAAGANQDVAFMIAAGNDGTRSQRWPAYANTYMNYVHSVMSVDMNLGVRSSFSNYGPWQTAMAPGDLVYCLDDTGTLINSPFQGTSAATPHVVNMAARIMSSGVSAKQAAAALKATVRDIGATDGQGATLYLYSMQAALRWLGKEPPIVITSPNRPQKPGLPLW